MHFSRSIENTGSDATGADIDADKKPLIGGSGHRFDRYLSASAMQLERGGNSEFRIWNV
jgi:hypothetical protein